MDLKSYFDNKTGLGVLSTADDKGQVNAAVYARPHFMQDGTLGFIAANRRTYHNLQSNASAVYLFKEDGPGYEGKRIYLRKVGETDDLDVIEPLRRRRYSPEDEAAMSPLRLVFFELVSELPLVGTE